MSDLIGLRAEASSSPSDTVYRSVDGYVIVETPSRPDFHDGNLIQVSAPYRLEDVPAWVEVFRREFGEREGVQHLGVWWELPWLDEPAPVAADLAALADGMGLETEFLEILELATLTFPGRRADIEARPVQPDEWDQVARLAGGFGHEIPTEFWSWRVGAFRAAADEGRGGHWLAWDGDAPVATGGLYHRDGFGTVQDVITHEQRRGRGIAGTLLHAALETVPPGTRVVIVVEPGTTAAALYRRLGFAPHSHLAVVKNRADR